MTGLDSNVLLRYIVRDDLAQAARADVMMRGLTPEAPGFVSLVALAEVTWVLRSFYRMPKAQLTACIERLLNAQNLVMEGSVAVRMAIARFSGAKCDFADCLIERLGFVGGCTRTVTFDAIAARAAGMRLI